PVRNVLVDAAVAVVVERVADLGRALTGRRAHVRREGALPAPADALHRHAAGALRRGRRGRDAAHLLRRGRGEVVVDGAVAVVVEPVADLAARDRAGAVFTLLVVVEVVEARIATPESAGAALAGPLRVHRAGVAIVAA